MLCPWGNVATTSQPPLSLAQVPSTAWAFSDADQLHPRVVAASWKANTPRTKLYGAHRLAARFDGSVGDIDDGELVIPTN